MPLFRLTRCVLLYSALCWGPPHQSSCFLPNPSQPTTQQVDRWSLRTLLWPGSLCPGICMMYSAQDPTAQRQAPRLSWDGVSGCLTPQIELSAASAVLHLFPLPSFLLLLLLLLHCCWLCIDILGVHGAPTISSFFLPQGAGWMHVSPLIHVFVVSWSPLGVMLPGHHMARISTLCGLRMQKGC